MRPGDRVYYPTPLPPVSHPDVGKQAAVPMLTGEEEWLSAEVAAVDRQVAFEHDHYDDADVATLDPGDGPPFQLAAMFLRRRPPAA
jgi:hypothetical protein